jgi:hypothetical protein
VLYKRHSKPQKTGVIMTNGVDRIVTSAGTLILVNEAAQTASGDSGAITNLGGVTAPKVQLHVTEVSGADFPTLTVVIEETLDGTNWNEIGKFSETGAVGRETISLSDPLAETIRVGWTITGTSPLIRFSVTSPACWSDA